MVSSFTSVEFLTLFSLLRLPKFFLCLCHPTLSSKALCFRLSCWNVHPFIFAVHSSGQILLLQNLMNGLNNFEKKLTGNDLIKFLRSVVKVIAGH